MVSQRIDLKGRNALVTGGARGIGAAVAKVLAREGANVRVADIQSTAQTVRDIQAFTHRAVGIQADVSNTADVQRMVAEAIDGLGHVDILVNCAGVIQRESLLETSEAIWDRVVAIDLKGTFLCIQAVYPHMRDRGYGKIVNISSIFGIIGGAVSKRQTPGSRWGARVPRMPPPRGA